MTMTRFFEFLVSMLVMEMASGFLPVMRKPVVVADSLMGTFDFVDQPLGGKGIGDRLCEQRESAKATTQQEMYGVLSTSRLQEGQSKVEQKALQHENHPGEQNAYPFGPATTPGANMDQRVQEK